MVGNACQAIPKYVVCTLFHHIVGARGGLHVPARSELPLVEMAKIDVHSPLLQAAAGGDNLKAAQLVVSQIGEQGVQILDVGGGAAGLLGMWPSMP